MSKVLRPFILAIVFGTAVATAAAAQVNIGLTGGVNFASVSGSDVSSFNLSSDNGWAGGAYLNLSLGSKLAVEGQLLYSQQGVKNDTLSVSQDYVQFPALLKYYFGSGGPRVNIFAGPAVGWSTSCSVDVTSVSADCDTSNIGNPSSTVWSGIIGLGVQFGRLGLEAHYQTGFSDAIENINAKYGVFAVMGRFAILGSR
jgi:hypothetical protein